jgi:hypothetical protein
MIRLSAGCRRTSVKRTTGTAPDAMTSASTEFFADGLAIEIRRDDRVLYDSPLEGDGFEPSVPRQIFLAARRSPRNSPSAI